MNSFIDSLSTILLGISAVSILIGTAVLGTLEDKLIEEEEKDSKNKTNNTEDESLNGNE